MRKLKPMIITVNFIVISLNFQDNVVVIGEICLIGNSSLLGPTSILYRLYFCLKKSESRTKNIKVKTKTVVVLKQGVFEREVKF